MEPGVSGANSCSGHTTRGLTSLPSFTTIELQFYLKRVEGFHRFVVFEGGLLFRVFFSCEAFLVSGSNLVFLFIRTVRPILCMFLFDYFCMFICIVFCMCYDFD